MKYSKFLNLMVNVKTNEEYQMGRNDRGHRHTKKQWTVQTQKSINTQRNQQHYTHNVIPVQQTLSIQRNQQHYTHIVIPVQQTLSIQRNQQHYTHNLIPVQQTLSIQRNQQYVYTHICILKNTSFDNKSSVYCRFSGKLICTLYYNTCHMNCVWP